MKDEDRHSPKFDGGAWEAYARSFETVLRTIEGLKGHASCHLDTEAGEAYWPADLGMDEWVQVALTGLGLLWTRRDASSWTAILAVPGFDHRGEPARVAFEVGIGEGGTTRLAYVRHWDSRRGAATTPSA